jgi:Nif-specific regulatory protein
MESLENKLREIEKDEIIRALKECNFVRARAARNLGIYARVIGYRIKKHGLRIAAVRSVEASGAEQYLHEE